MPVGILSLTVALRHRAIGRGLRKTLRRGRHSSVPIESALKRLFDSDGKRLYV